MNNKEIAGCGGIDFYTLLPTYQNPTGKNASIMNMYTKPTHRRKGIATDILQKSLEEAKIRDVSRITLEATKYGMDLYRKNGFTHMNNEMEYQQRLP